MAPPGSTARPSPRRGRCLNFYGRPSAAVLGLVLRLLPQEIQELVEQSLLVDEPARQFQLALVVPDHRVVEAVQGVSRALAHAALLGLGGGPDRQCRGCRARARWAQGR